MTATLSPRLAAVASLVLPGLPLADVGTDHGYLPVALVADGTVPRAVATDIAAKPATAAQRYVIAAGYAGAVAVRVGNGLTTMAPGEAATIVIAGMGGCLIRDILAATPDIALSAHRLVLQPMRDAAVLRRWLWAAGWSICAERMAREGERYYTVIAVERSQGRGLLCDAACAGLIACDAGVSEDLIAELGPLVVAGPDPLLGEWLEREIGLVARLDAEIARAPGSGQSRRQALSARRRELTALLEQMKRA